MTAQERLTLGLVSILGEAHEPDMKVIRALARDGLVRQEMNLAQDGLRWTPTEAGRKALA